MGREDQADSNDLVTNFRYRALEKNRKHIIRHVDTPKPDGVFSFLKDVSRTHGETQWETILKKMKTSTTVLEETWKHVEDYARKNRSHLQFSLNDALIEELTEALARQKSFDNVANDIKNDREINHLIEVLESTVKQVAQCDDEAFQWFDAADKLDVNKIQEIIHKHVIHVQYLKEKLDDMTKKNKKLETKTSDLKQEVVSLKEMLTERERQLQTSMDKHYKDVESLIAKADETAKKREKELQQMHRDHVNTVQKLVSKVDSQPPKESAPCPTYNITFNKNIKK